MEEEYKFFTFEEAISLMGVGAHGYNFKNEKGGKFTVVYDMQSASLVIKEFDAKA